MVPGKGVVRLITYTKEIVNGEPIYMSSNCLPKKALKYEPAGHAFHEAAMRLGGFFEEETDDEVKEVKPTAEKEQYMPSSGSYSTKGKKKPGTDNKEQDHYALLNLSHLRYLATEEQIRKSYRETALKYHPDKQAALLLTEETEVGKQAKKEEIEAHFKHIHEAYEVLMDPVKRRIYDSTDEFDDEIPTDCDPQDFYKVFGPAFMRNGRWSVAQPVPALGDDIASLKEVDDFYNFWYNFKSWREFPHEDEYDLEQAESRDHKRWMERQNAKLSEKSRKEEYVRIRSLVDNAYKRDPRIVRRKEQEKAEKQKKKQAKYLAKQLEEEKAAKEAEEEKRLKEEEYKRAAEANALQKKAKEKEKKLLRKERSRLRALSAAVMFHSHNVTEDDVEGLCISLGMEELKNLCDELDGKETAAQAGILRGTLGREAPKGSLQDEKKPVHQNGSVTQNGTIHLASYQKKENGKPWGKEEIEMLRKGMVKYPKGTSRRWEVISEYIGTGRTVDEILKATKTVLLQKPDSNKAFDSFLEKRKASPSIESPLSIRDDVVDATSAPATAANPADLGAAEQKPEQAAANELPSSSDSDQWSAVQEKALIQALKTFPKEANQRWERVAGAVPGKTVNQCKKKFALLKESFRSKKT